MTTGAKEPTAGNSVRTGGYVHAAAWILGLAAAWGVAPEACDTPTEITTAYTDQPVQTAAQALLVHGAAALGLLVVGSGLLGWARRTGNSAGRWAGWAGTVAGVLAYVQLALD